MLLDSERRLEKQISSDMVLLMETKKDLRNIVKEQTGALESLKKTKINLQSELQGIATLSDELTKIRASSEDGNVVLQSVELQELIKLLTPIVEVAVEKYFAPAAEEVLKDFEKNIKDSVSRTENAVILEMTTFTNEARQALGDVSELENIRADFIRNIDLYNRVVSGVKDIEMQTGVNVYTATSSIKSLYYIFDKFLNVMCQHPEIFDSSAKEVDYFKKYVSPKIKHNLKEEVSVATQEKPKAKPKVKAKSVSQTESKTRNNTKKRSTSKSPKKIEKSFVGKIIDFFTGAR